MSRQQVPTRSATIEEIMAHPAFELGAADVRAGKPPRPDYDCWPDINNQWNYERGRVWALLAPRNCKLKRDGKVTDEAMKWAIVYGDDIP
jgi:hypothetical protein